MDTGRHFGMEWDWGPEGFSTSDPRPGSQVLVRGFGLESPSFASSAQSQSAWPNSCCGNLVSHFPFNRGKSRWNSCSARGHSCKLVTDLASLAYRGQPLDARRGDIGAGGRVTCQDDLNIHVEVCTTLYAWAPDEEHGMGAHMEHWELRGLSSVAVTKPDPGSSQSLGERGPLPCSTEGQNIEKEGPALADPAVSLALLVSVLVQRLLGTPSLGL